MILEEATPSIKTEDAPKARTVGPDVGLRDGAHQGLSVGRGRNNKANVSRPHRRRPRVVDEHASEAAQGAGAAPPRPHPQRLVERVFAPYEDLVKDKGRLVTVPVGISLCGGLRRKSIVGPRRRGGEPGGDRSSSSRHGGVPITFCYCRV